MQVQLICLTSKLPFSCDLLAMILFASIGLLLYSRHTLYWYEPITRELHLSGASGFAVLFRAIRGVPDAGVGSNLTMPKTSTHILLSFSTKLPYLIRTYQLTNVDLLS